MRSSRNFGPGRTTLQLGASPMPSMNAVARATVEARSLARRAVSSCGSPRWRRRMSRPPFRRIKYS